jgi:ABC-type Na+ efflux pump permease subunit
MRTIVSVARLSLIDRIRDRRLVVAELAPSLALVGMLLVLSFSIGNADRGGDDRESFTLGISGDLSVVDGLEAELRARRFELVQVADPVRTILQDQVEAVLVLHGSDARDATVVDRSGNDGSRVAGLLARAALADHIREGAGAEAVASVEQRPDRRKPPETLALVVAFIPVFFAAGAGRGVVARLTGASEARVLEAQLALPLDRRGLLGGHCLAEVLAGLAKEGIVLGLGVIAVVAVGALEQGPVVGLVAGALVVAAVLAQASVMALVGVLAAAGSAVCRVLVTGGWIVAAMALVVWSRGEPAALPWIASAVPGVGPAVGVRELLAGHPAGPALLVGWGSTLAALAVLLRRGVRAVDADALSVAATQA